MPNVIRVQLYHHQGMKPRKPEFQLKAQPTPEVNIHDDAQAVTLTSGRLTVHVEKQNDWQIDFKDGDRLITRSGWRGMGFVDTEDAAYQHGRYIHDQLALGVGEYVYGLGERFTPFVKNGQVVDIWNEDGGTSSEQAYKNIPFYLTNRGYGVLVNHPERVSFEIASEKVQRVQFSVPGEVLDALLKRGLEHHLALTYGDHVDVLEKLAQLRQSGDDFLLTRPVGTFSTHHPAVGKRRRHLLDPSWRWFAVCIGEQHEFGGAVVDPAVRFGRVLQILDVQPQFMRLHRDPQEPVDNQVVQNRNIKPAIGRRLVRQAL